VQLQVNEQYLPLLSIFTHPLIDQVLDIDHQLTTTFDPHILNCNICMEALSNPIFLIYNTQFKIWEFIYYSKSIMPFLYLKVRDM
jgi:hypothetical protein